MAHPDATKPLGRAEAPSSCEAAVVALDLSNGVRRVATARGGSWHALAAPQPMWRRRDLARDTLPRGDPGRQDRVR